ncbi:hypothetical protein CSW21_00775 [Thermus scotoductus]|uniref:Uncharacterized protein n=1 Tax=Thermus scotoductus TaxID=37636 RepID=A0A430RGA7_THESC|nr:hypothetical protein CSW49_00795 [Thermus scotoductus]RTH07076.1 hypothetical protein CSW45_00925 [Thermus scotoductus]RTH23664.1 hypothetical protein CSW42_00420 [Thermus scotoductus]RTI03235.1 hypothetical protein CSW28_00385 [Thermus scotoductus]RTI25187.1 hypothetical protein CSW21_00775 [Thermus scotoductus]
MVCKRQDIPFWLRFRRRLPLDEDLRAEEIIKERVCVRPFDSLTFNVENPFRYHPLARFAQNRFACTSIPIPV